MSIDSELLQIDVTTENANSVKEIVLSRLATDNIITVEQAQEYASKWNVIIIKPSWFKRWKDRFNVDNNIYKFKYVRFED